MAQEAGYYIDVKNALMSITPRHGIGADSRAHFNVANTIGSAFEHAILEQLMGSDNPGISTIKLLQIANAQGSKVFFADANNFASIKPQLQDYSTETLNDLQNQVNSGRTLILPDDGKLGVGEWKGAGYITRFNEGYNTFLGMMIEGGYYGGYASLPKIIKPKPILKKILKTIFKPSRNITIQTPASQDPVDMATGEYLYDRTDIALGSSAPSGLAFSRSYKSSQNLVKRSLGNGWTHNYDINLSSISDGDPGLGTRQPVDAAAMITTLYIALDLMKNQDDLKGWIVMCLAHKWAVDQLIDNAVTVHLGGKISEYIQLPDNSYNPPPGVTTQLIDNGNDTFSMKERFGAKLDFGTDNRISKLTDIDGNELTFTYTNEQLTKVRDTVGRTLILQYTGENITSVTDSTGRTVSYGYDNNNNLTAATDLEGKVWRFGYDASHQMTILTNPLGIVTAANTYDSLGQVKTQTVPRQSGSAVYNFYFSGYRNAEKDPYGKEIIYHFDKKGRTVGLEDESGNKTVKKLDGQNHEIEITDPRENITTFEYDQNNNLTKTKNALNNETVNTYDGQFRLIETKDPLNHTTGFDYDSEHHLTKTTDAELNGIDLTYYSNGTTETATDSRGTTAVLTYDSYNNPKTGKTGTHPAVRYTYDPIGRMTSLTDQEGAVTNFTYDKRGLLLTQTDPLGKTTTYTYDAAGRMTSRTDRNDHTTNYTYTTSDKLDTVTYPDNTTVKFTYDLHDKVTRMQDTLGTAAYIYDELYRLSSSTDANGFTVTYEYDQAGNPTKITYPNSKAVIYTYDQLNRLKTVTNWLNQTATYTYDPAGRLTSLTNFNTTKVTYDYDTANRLTTLKNLTSANSTISSYVYTLDQNGNRTQIDKAEPLASTIPISTTAYTYNQTKNRLLSAGTTDFSYDHQGQISTKDTETYIFDYEHRLTNISGTNTIQYKYNGKGSRLEATRNGAVTRYIHDAAGSLIAQADQTNTITRYYIYGLGLLAMITPADEIYTYHYNGIGSTIALTDQTQTAVNKYTYTPFGIIVNKEETIPQPFKYVGQHGVMAEPNGLYYMRARYYDPTVGRFISEDPSGFGGGINLYAYAVNNPINYYDSNGRWPVGAVAGAVGGAYTGFMSGLANGGNLGAAVVGGVAGGIAGGIVGAFLDDASGSVAGTLVGGAVGGAVGGFVGNTVSNVLSGREWSDGAIPNTFLGAGVGLSGAAAGSAMIATGATATQAAVASQILTAPYAIAGSTFLNQSSSSSISAVSSMGVSGRSRGK